MVDKVEIYETENAKEFAAWYHDNNTNEDHYFIADALLPRTIANGRQEDVENMGIVIGYLECGTSHGRSGYTGQKIYDELFYAIKLPVGWYIVEIDIKQWNVNIKDKNAKYFNVVDQYGNERIRIRYNSDWYEGYAIASLCLFNIDLINSNGRTIDNGLQTEKALSVPHSYDVQYCQYIDDGITWIGDKTAKDTIEVLKTIVDDLGTERGEDTFVNTPGNAGYIANILLELAIEYPDAKWFIWPHVKCK